MKKGDRVKVLPCGGVYGTIRAAVTIHAAVRSGSRPHFQVDYDTIQGKFRGGLWSEHNLELLPQVEPTHSKGPRPVYARLPFDRALAPSEAFVGWAQHRWGGE